MKKTSNIKTYPLNYCNFIGDTSVKCGGAITVISSPLIVNNCNFTNCLADLNGGAIYCYGDYTGTTRINNSEFIGNTANRNGGAISFNMGTLIIDMCNFSSNNGLSGGAINLGDGEYTNYVHELNVADSYFENIIS